MITKLLIANRGEIARRIIRTCDQMGIATVAVFSDADADAPFVLEAGEAYALGGNSPSESYLRGDLIITAALATGADAIHPGYGFLAENAAFAESCADAGIAFVGPSPAAISAMGDKLAAKRLMEDAGVATLPSVLVSEADLTAATHAAEEIGYPVLVKASAGGGGKGMRIVETPDSLEAAISGASREALSSFGDGTVFLEKYLKGPRHVEVQVFADEHGNTVHLFERECSIQRRHQKIIEEAPSPAVDAKLRAALGRAAVKACEAVDYVGAGTIEFLLSGTSFYFLEMNTRLQVEHPVTEFVTGLDLVRLQIEVAEGAPLPPAALSPTMTGHAIEARLYAEDPLNGYLPSIGTIEHFSVDGVRLDSAVVDGSDVSVHYDPMIAKVIVHASSRPDAIRRLANALANASIHGVTTNRDLLVGILRHEEFIAGNTDTHFLERHTVDALGAPRLDAAAMARHAVAAALVGQYRRRQSAAVVAGLPTGWRNSPSQRQRVQFNAGDRSVDVAYAFGRDRLDVSVDDVEHEVTIHALTESEADLQFGPQRLRYAVRSQAGPLQGERWLVDGPDGSSDLTEVPRFPTATIEVAVGSMLAPMPGKVVRVDVAESDVVKGGATLVIIEAMKMEHSVSAPAAGTVTSVNVAVGDQVDADQLLVVLDAESDD